MQTTSYKIHSAEVVVGFFSQLFLFTSSLNLYFLIAEIAFNSDTSYSRADLSIEQREIAFKGNTGHSKLWTAYTNSSPA